MAPGEPGIPLTFSSLHEARNTETHRHGLLTSQDSEVLLYTAHAAAHPGT